MANTISAAEVRQKVMDFLSCPEEEKEFIRSIPEGLLCEWMYLCVLDGMPLADLKRIQKISAISGEQKVHMLRQERQKFLQARYMDGGKINQQIKELHQKVKDAYEESRTLREILDSSIKHIVKTQEESMKHQEHSTQLLLNGKDELIRERDKKILELKAQLREWEEKEEQKKTVQVREEKGKEEQEERSETIPKRRKRIWPFRRDLSRIFIRKYLENDAYDEDQREFLLHCLEEGDTAEEMEQYAIPALSVAMMERLRKLVKERS